MTIASIYVLFCFLWVSPTYNHALYVSVIDVEQDENSKKCEVILKVFSDDLQNSIRNFSSEYQQYPTESFVKPNQNLIEKYFNTYIEIRINGEKLLLELTKSEKENDAHFLYFNSESPLQWEEFKISAPYFMELFPEQSNIIRLKYESNQYNGRITLDSKEFIQRLSH